MRMSKRTALHFLKINWLLKIIGVKTLAMRIHLDRAYY